jgi:hypothetical protein
MTGQVPFLSWAKLQTGFYEWSGKQSKIKNTTAGFAIQITPSLSLEFGRRKQQIALLLVKSAYSLAQVRSLMILFDDLVGLRWQTIKILL